MQLGYAKLRSLFWGSDWLAGAACVCVCVAQVFARTIPRRSLEDNDFGAVFPSVFPFLPAPFSPSLLCVYIDFFFLLCVGLVLCSLLFSSISTFRIISLFHHFTQQLIPSHTWLRVENKQHGRAEPPGGWKMNTQNKTFSSDYFVSEGEFLFMMLTKNQKENALWRDGCIHVGQDLCG